MKLYAERMIYGGEFKIWPALILRFPKYSNQLLNEYSLSISWGLWYLGLTWRKQK